MKKERTLHAFQKLLDIVETLRGPNGCPWDKKQTHMSLIPFLLEEAYETAAAIESEEINKISDELGDVLLQVILHAQIASEKKEFDILTIIESITDKLIRRHPHVFGSKTVENADDVIKQWKNIKQKEINLNSSDPFHDIPNHLPPLLEAQKSQERAAQFSFDWSNTQEVLAKVKEELEELAEAISKDNIDNIEEELGDMFFALVNLSRFLGVNPILALRKANLKFKKRFVCMIKQLKNPKIMEKMSLAELDDLWEKAKDQLQTTETNAEKHQLLPEPEKD